MRRETTLHERLANCYPVARDALLAERNAAGYWTGELSTSALSTATAVMALEMVRRADQRSEVRGQRSATTDHRPRTTDRPLTPYRSPLARLITGGLGWLAEHQNADGGWGDTVKSLSNISTTMLAHASFHAAGIADEYRSTVDAARGYIDGAGGVAAVLKRYGKDRTFSIPILTHCALAGLVNWRDVMPLPFELACLPARFFKTVRLPVVSYALPALIAIGQARFHHRKPRNLLTRAIRSLAVKPSLRVLERIQPPNGGFLEATPLTSFVTMSLASIGLADHPVTRRGMEFIVNSVRPDGSWPIDTNLATWVTTLSVNALGPDLPEKDRPPIRDWLLGQQYRDVHPYTNADPGGWAWTDLPGGVPDADDTPGAVLALLNLADRRRRTPVSEHPDGSRWDPDKPPDWVYVGNSREIQAAIDVAVDWLLNLQNADGGIPTFCRGWGSLPFDRSSCDLSAHTATALQLWSRQTHPWSQGPVAPRYGRASIAADRILGFLRRSQRSDGSWLPLWFGNQYASNGENATYGTARVLMAYRELGFIGEKPAREEDVSSGVLLPPPNEGEDEREPARRGLRWLRDNQNDDGGWGGIRGTPSSVEETALAVEVMLSDDPYCASVQRGLEWLLEKVEDGTFREASPIGFYFAKLWYFERLYPLAFTVAALRRARECFTVTNDERRR